MPRRRRPDARLRRLLYAFRRYSMQESYFAVADEKERLMGDALCFVAQVFTMPFIAEHVDALSARLSLIF